MESKIIAARRISIDPVRLHLELRLGIVFADLRLRIHPNFHGPVNVESRRVLFEYLSPAAEVDPGIVDRKRLTQRIVSRETGLTRTSKPKIDPPSVPSS